MSKSRAKKKQRQRSRAVAGDQVPVAAMVAQQQTAPAGAGAAAATAAERAAQRAAARDAGGSGGERRPSRLQERDGVTRPDPPWAPFPLTEIGMAVGLVLFGIGFATGPYLLVIGAAVLAVATAELCLREHFAGFRSHSVLLGLLPVTAVHMLVYYAFTPAWRGPVALVVDLSIAGALAWWLQRRFRRAQALAQLAR